MKLNRLPLPKPVRFGTPRKVLVDAPCSGDGTLRKSPAGWLSWRASEAKALHKLQRGEGRDRLVVVVVVAWALLSHEQMSNG